MDTKIVRHHTTTVSFDSQQIVDTLDEWSRNYSTRRELRNLDDKQLTDIGVDRITAQRESNKPFWRS